MYHVMLNGTKVAEGTSLETVTFYASVKADRDYYLALANDCEKTAFYEVVDIETGETVAKY